MPRQKKEKAAAAQHHGLIDASKSYPLDETDKSLIKILMSNGRMSNIDIAQRLDTSEATVRRRIDNLTRSGVIRNFAALLDNKKLGHTLKASVLLKVGTSYMEKVAKEVMQSNNSCAVYRVIGKYNLYTEMVFDDIQAFQDYLDALSEMDEVEGYDYHIVTHAYKPCPWSGL